MALILLLTYRWNSNQLQQDYIDNDIAVKQKSGVLSSTTAADMPANCGICLAPLIKADSLGRRHFFCKSCWLEYCKLAIRSGKDCLLAKCLYVGCRMGVLRSFFARYVPGELFDQYHRLVCESFTDENKAVKWCPAANCKYLAQNEQLMSSEVTCKCGYRFCFGFSCGEEAHMPCTCEMMRMWELKNSSES